MAVTKFTSIEMPTLQQSLEFLESEIAHQENLAVHKQQQSDSSQRPHFNRFKNGFEGHRGQKGREFSSFGSCSKGPSTIDALAVGSNSSNKGKSLETCIFCNKAGHRSLSCFAIKKHVRRRKKG